MASCFPDDEFDWEAAVKEIDDACQGVALASNSGDFGYRILDESVENSRNAQANTAKRRRIGGIRQATLDGFVETDGKCGTVSHTIDANLWSNEGLYPKINLEAAKTWVYPVNVPLREYQLSISRTALFANTLVALPTGLGKTLIAAVVMYNYFRWFPEGKIVFAAPSRPLVMQQIEACHNIVGIPQEWTIDMTGQTSPADRPSFWKAKRVFFLTPQAHRAMGNYSYGVAVRELMAVHVQFRILALTATPGSKQQTVQKVIDNLHISVLEYRNESHPDVCSYVHSRKLELMKVAMGKDAIGINNLLLEAIRPFVSRLCALGVLSNRDSATLSPCQLLTSRDKFRQAPPVNLPHTKFGEVEGYFGVLITLYHIRKLLSSHGIKPAYEMLREKLQQGSFAKFMCRNEVIWQAKLLMEQSLSHGAPNPKLLKMVEVLVDHFETKDPKNSRVIIFSNFRGSVKDIMETLAKIGEPIKATQFIGQSSGKALTGQSQKLQQAVLKKFRAGGYNVIVATSIGEEGLDIMEVDLVICFDANISPLRMIQRMGRTGRKNDGRVVVLACEGSELKGYMTKQENSKSVAKHMHSGGTNSFNFHSSPRMVPHSCKPEVQFVELSIEQFVPRGRKGKRETVDNPTCASNISDVEAALIAKYFHSSKDVWKPSLIAFPHFQGFPSRVHKVRHSFQTTVMLIDTMQLLKELSSVKAEPVPIVEFGTYSSQHLEAVNVVRDDISKRDSASYCEAPKVFSESKISDFKTSPAAGTSGSDDEQCIADVQTQNTCVHSFLFGADFVSVDGIGRVLISSVPTLPLMKEVSSYKGTLTTNITELLKSAAQDTSPVQTSPNECDKKSMHSKSNMKLTCSVVPDSKPNCDVCTQKALAYDEETVPQTPISEVKLTTKLDDDDDDDDDEMPGNMEKELSYVLIGDSRAIELSPRLTNFVEKGIVPESPMVERAITHSPMVEEAILHSSVAKAMSRISCSSDFNLQEKETPTSKTRCSLKLFDGQEKNKLSAVANVSPSMPEPGTGSSLPLNLNSEKNEKTSMHANSGKINLEGNILDSPFDKENHTPLVNRTSSSCIEDWQLSTGEASKKSMQQSRRLKRLRKLGDADQRPPSKTTRNTRNKCSNIKTNLCEIFMGTESRSVKHHNSGGPNAKARLEDFIDEEAEVSSDAEVSADEDDRKEDSEYDDSFIDDRVNPTEASMQGGDMMAIYRRSLLTQSPLEDGQKWYCANSGHESQSPTATRSENCSSSAKMNNSLQRTPFESGPTSPNLSNVGNLVASCGLGSESVSVIALGCESKTLAHQRKKKEGPAESRTRKLDFQQVGSVAATVLGEYLLQPETINKTSDVYQSHNIDVNTDTFYNDQFYEDLDLDEMEAQATEMVRHKSEALIGKKQITSSDPCTIIKGDMDLDFLRSPSFDLGI